MVPTGGGQFVHLAEGVVTVDLLKHRHVFASFPSNSLTLDRDVAQLVEHLALRRHQLQRGQVYDGGRVV